MNEDPETNLLQAQRELYSLLQREKEKAWKLEIKELEKLKEQRKKQLQKIEYWTDQVLKKPKEETKIKKEIKKKRKKKKQKSSDKESMQA